VIKWTLFSSFLEYLITAFSYQPCVNIIHLHEDFDCIWNSSFCNKNGLEVKESVNNRLPINHNIEPWKHCGGTYDQ